MKTRPPPEECANCGGDIPHNARACPHCGADERTGWRETSIYDGLDLPDEDEASSPGQASRRTGLPWYWSAVLIVLLLLMLMYAFGISP